MLQKKEKDKVAELREVETVNLLDKKLKVMVIKMIKELQRKIEKQSKKLEVFKEEIENINWN